MVTRWTFHPWPAPRALLCACGHPDVVHRGRDGSCQAAAARDDLPGVYLCPCTGWRAPELRAPAHRAGRRDVSGWVALVLLVVAVLLAGALTVVTDGPDVAPAIPSTPVPRPQPGPAPTPTAWGE